MLSWKRVLAAKLSALLLCFGLFFVVKAPPPLQAGAFGVSALPAIPSYATAFGFTKFNRYFAFSDNTSIDLGKTNAPGYAWYITNPPKFVPHFCGGGTCPDVDASWYTNPSSNRTLVVTSNTNPAGGGETMSFSWTSPSTVVGQPVWLGSAGFYFETLIKIDYTVDQCAASGGFLPDVWIQDRPGTISQLFEGNGAFRFGEIDVVEGCVNLDSYNNLIAQTIVDWSSWDTNSYARSGLPIAPSSEYRRHGVLMVPMALNAGTGFVKWYIDGVQTGSTISWTAPSDFAAILESGQFQINFAAGKTIPLSMKYIYVATP